MIIHFVVSLAGAFLGGAIVSALVSRWRDRHFARRLAAIRRRIAQ
jgi:hypothetical protein